MKRNLSLFALRRLICALMVVCALLSCGLTAFAAEEGLPEALYPTDVQTVIEDTGRQIVKTYTLTAGESPDHIPRDSFELDGWLYELTDVTQSKATGGADVRSHTETVELSTENNDLNEIIGQLAPTLDYESEDGYRGLLTLDLASVKCEAAGYESSGYTVTVMREYQHLPANDLYFIPKSITDNGRTLALDSVEWQEQTFVNVGYTDVPDSYRAIAKYTGKAVQSVVTEYITKADYTGELTKTIAGDTVYTAFFTGTEINPAPEEPEAAPAPDKDSGSMPVVPIIGSIIIIALAGAGFLFLRHNAEVFGVDDDGRRVVLAKVRISAKNPVIDLTPLDSRSEIKCFGIEIDRLAAKGLNGKTVEVVFGSAKLSHKIAYEGNPYEIVVNFHDLTIKAIYQ